WNPSRSPRRPRPERRDGRRRTADARPPDGRAAVPRLRRRRLTGTATRGGGGADPGAIQACRAGGAAGVSAGPQAVAGRPTGDRRTRGRAHGGEEAAAATGQTRRG